MPAVGTQPSQNAEDTPTPTHQRRITDYFLSQDSKTDQHVDSQHKADEEETTAPNVPTVEEASSSKPSYLSVALKALRRDEQERESHQTCDKHPRMSSQKAIRKRSQQYTVESQKPNRKPKRLKKEQTEREKRKKKEKQTRRQNLNREKKE